MRVFIQTVHSHPIRQGKSDRENIGNGQMDPKGLGVQLWAHGIRHVNLVHL